MVTRFLIFAGLQGLAAALGYWAMGDRYSAVVGALTAAWLWFLIDLVRAARVLRWLQRDVSSRVPASVGVLGEFGERVQRLSSAHVKATAESERQLAGILEALQATPNGVVLLDERERIVWCNHHAARHLSFDLERDALQFVGNLVRDPDFAQYLAARSYVRDVVITTRPTAEARAARVSIQLCAYGAGQKLMLTRDVTAVEQADDMRRDFVANVSHEIRTPLTVLSGFIETLQTLNLAADEQERYLALMAQQAQRMQRVVEGLLALSRLEASPPPGMQEWVSVRALLARSEQEALALSAIVSQGQKLSFPDVALNESGVDPYGEIAGMSVELQSALSNLVSNAVRYTPGTGSIVVRWTWRQEGGGAVLSVQDNGPGIDPEHLPRITERFYRVDRSRSRDTGGTGLGLAIVKHVAQRHGAQLQIESVLGKGSTFSLVFPASRLRGMQEGESV